MSTIDTRPQSVNLKIYGGDDLTFRVNVTGADYSAATWTGQVRLDHDSSADANFTIDPDLTGADVLLDGVSTAALLDLGVTETPEFGAPKSSLVRKYFGVWDIQVDDGGVKTLVQGLIEVYADVTRA
jgi:hypothetical protein